MGTNAAATSRAILWITGAALALQVLIVPWKPRLEGTPLEGLAGGAGYRPIWASDGSSVDVTRLLLQLAITVGLAAAALSMARRRS
jgi:hypothetical protein